MKAILAADQNWGIGFHGKLLVSIPADMRFFRKSTTNKVVVMGRKTLDSMPQGKPLPNRVNIILTRNENLSVPGALVLHSVDELLEERKKYPPDDVYVIGGAEIYRLLLPYCDTIYVTKIHYAYQADAFFPNLDEDPAWELMEESEEQTYFDLEYTFNIYVRKEPA